MKTSEIKIRDPFILVHDNKYFLYGSGRRNGSSLCGFDVVTSTDLENWSEPKTIFEENPDFWATKDYWAPEVHKYKGKFYLFASFKSDDRCRGTQILVCDTPDGKFEPLTQYPVTPENWECLDGTLFFENGKAVSIPMKCYETKTNRRKLTNAFSEDSKTVGIFFVPEHKGRGFASEYLLVSDSGKAIIMNSSQLTQKVTRTSSGVIVFTLKKGQKIKTVSLFVDDQSEKMKEFSRYRKTKLPSTGTTVTNAKQLTFL